MPVTLDQKSGLEKVVLQHAGSTAEIFLHGAHVTSFKRDGKDVIFVSKEAIYQPPKAIRGGVPVCWPQFNDMGDGQSHGFARNSAFTVVDGSDTFVTLLLASSEATRLLWPHLFELRVRIEITPRGALHQSVEAKNTGFEPMTTTCALHTYFAVASIKDTMVTGLEGSDYLDNLAGRSKVTGCNSSLHVKEEVDRIYIATDDSISIVDTGNKRRITLQKENFPDAVVWNPWIAKSKTLPDFHDTEYLHMLCIEPTNAAGYKEGKAVTIEAGATWKASQTISVSPL